ncbi:ABC transporter permease [Roseobacter sp.]|uniref:ABC transporter permease n=1 Tax=Roseobacter sp. TaxID=1907202 RepID=UPI00385BBEAB
MTSADLNAPTSAGKGFGFLARNPGLVPPLGLLVPLVLLVVLITVINPVFVDGRNVFNVFRQIAIFLILGTGMTIVMAARGIDLSVGSTVALAGCVAGLVLKSGIFGDGLGSIMAIVAAVGVGAAVGCVNGFAVTTLKVPPLIVTLGTLTAVRGLAYLVMGSDQVRNFPEQFLWIGQGRIFGLPAAGAIALVVVLLGAFLMNCTRFGTYVLAVGGDRSAAIRAGIRVRRYEMGAYILCGALAGLAGAMLVARLNAAQAVLGATMELHAIAVVVLGGTFLFGGYATLLGTFFGAVFLGVAENGLLLMGVPFYWQQIVIGTTLVVAVAIQLYRFRRRGMASG